MMMQQYDNDENNDISQLNRSSTSFIILRNLDTFESSL